MIWALHGAVGMAADWRAFAAGLPPSFGAVRRLDLWRFLDCCPMPLEKFGATLAEEVRRIDPEPILLGYSMGGRLALHALLAQPDLWKSAVIVSAHPGLRDEAGRKLRRKKDAEWSALALKGEWSDFLTKWNAQGVLAGGAGLPDRSRLRDRRASVARSFVDWSLGAQDDLVPEFHRIACPVLWLTGDRDKKFTGLAESAVPHLPGGKHLVLPGCGHRVPWEVPSEFSGICAQFLGG
ncbi:hypothetical protein CSB20_07805, partial [bacterium DOLZORAL124_64_63]